MTSDSRGSVYFSGSAKAGSATLYIDAGDAVGGNVVFQDTSDGGTARAILAGTGVSAGGLDISLLSSAGMGIGSIEGDGIVSLGSKFLTVGSNNLDTTFSGLLRDGGYSGQVGGGLGKVGTGTLIILGANTYTGPTTITAGTLRVNEATGQGLGTSSTLVNRAPLSNTPRAGAAAAIW